MPHLVVNGQVTQTDVANTSAGLLVSPAPAPNLTLSSSSTIGLSVLTVSGPMGPSGASIVGPPGPMGTGSASSISGYATGLFNGPVGGPAILRATTGNLIEVLGNGVSGSAPVINSVNLLVSQPIFGSTGFLLGQPDGWWSFVVSGRAARVPYYYA